MKKTAIAIMTAMIIMLAGLQVFAAEDFALKTSYPQDGQKNTSIENLGVKLIFNKPVNSPEAKKADAKLIKMLDKNGKKVPIDVLFSEQNDGIVLAVADINTEGFKVLNNSEYKLVVDKNFTDNDGNTLGEDVVITFKTYNQKANNYVNMGMMIIMFGGITFISIRQNTKKEEEEAPKQEVKETFNPYREAKRTGKSVDEVRAEQAKKEEKLARKKSKKKSNTHEHDKKIENCAELLNNVYHVKAPAPKNKADRSIEAMRELRRKEKKAAEAEKAAMEAKAKAKKKKK